MAFDMGAFIMGPGDRAKYRYNKKIIILCGQAKLVIWITKRNRIQERHVLDLRGMVLEQIGIECPF